MSENVEIQFELSGHWHGFYVQSQKQHRIEATITQDGKHIYGQMIDVDNVSDEPLYDALANAGCAPGTDEEVAEQVRELIPEAGDEPITSHTVLPEQSTIEGSVSGHFVRFRKHYQGQSLHAYRVGDKGIGEVLDGHTVEYNGQISSDRSTIVGRWTIYGSGTSRGYQDGGFELKRVEN